MFEKEAEEYALVSLPDGYTKINHQKRVDFQKGAEFGYNKCFEQIRKIVNEGTRLDCIISELLRLQEKEGK